MKKIATVAVLAITALIAACTNEGGVTDAQRSQPQTQEAAQESVRLDKEELLKAIGNPQTSRYELDDGEGLKTMNQDGPVLKLEFRQGRVNIAWEVFNDDAKHEETNKQNAALAKQALEYAIGPKAASEAMQAIETQKPAKLDALGHQVRVMPGSMQNLITISTEKK